jgi:hypothetical protein
MKSLMYGILLAGSLSAGAAFADPSSSNTVSSDDQKSRIICKEVEVTGSLLPGPRICHTKAEWDEIQRQSEATLREVQDKGSIPPGK